VTTVVGPDLLRDLTPRAVAALVRRYGHLEDCEDAVQEALAAATTQWPVDGVPDNPRGWLITVASRRLIEQWRRDSARERREQRIGRFPAPAETAEVARDLDDSLPLLLMCCHPGLARPAQVSLTLRAVGGLTTAEIARGLLLPEATVAQRISRAKRRLEEVGARFETPTTSDEWAARLPPALEVLYLIFNEGSTASAGDQVSRPDLSGEAIRLTRQLHGQVDHGEVAGLLALMLLTDARRPARTDSAGESVALAEQDRRIWRTDAIAEGTKILRGALARHRIGPLQLQAAIAALHTEAASTAATDWLQILALYDHLLALAPSPMALLSRVVAVAQVRGPQSALVELDAVADLPGLVGHYRVDAVRAHLAEQAGDPEAARVLYLRAAQHSLSRPEQRHLLHRAQRLG
jgi:RNA polymerase sigma factor (sigma-70 family)